MPNLLQDIPHEIPEEVFETLVNGKNIRIERILSKGHSSPLEGWYDQDTDEFVMVLQGTAGLSFEDGRKVDMSPGDWLEIPAHVKHRVDWTDPEGTVWLAVHYH